MKRLPKAMPPRPKGGAKDSASAPGLVILLLGGPPPKKGKPKK